MNMRKYNGSLIELPKKGKAIIITDLHGNLKDYNSFMNIWEHFKSENNHLIITGDFIQNGNENDRSIEIMDSIIYNLENDDNFHVLLGNHEWSIITGSPVFKAGENLNIKFENLLIRKFGDKYTQKLEIYKEFFKKLPIAVKTMNKVFISHAGPPTSISNINEIINITNSGYINNRKLFEILWNRCENFSKDDVNSFLKNIGCNVMVVGHTPVDGTKLACKNQLIISSSYSAGKKAFLELDLEKEIKKGKELLKMVKYLK
ncbi:serine/threonine-protein phosphatase PP1 catalytic subunit [Methanobacterium oryzae]